MTTVQTERKLKTEGFSRTIGVFDERARRDISRSNADDTTTIRRDGGGDDSGGDNDDNDDGDGTLRTDDGVVWYTTVVPGVRVVRFLSMLFRSTPRCTQYEK